MGTEKTPRRRHRRRARADCRRGSHRFGSPKDIGGGIARQICSVCGAVSIDLGAADSYAESVQAEFPPRHARP